MLSSCHVTPPGRATHVHPPRRGAGGTKKGVVPSAAPQVSRPADGHPSRRAEPYPIILEEGRAYRATGPKTDKWCTIKSKIRQNRRGYRSASERVFRFRPTRRGGEGEGERIARQDHQQNQQSNRLFCRAAQELGHIHDRRCLDFDPVDSGRDRACLALEVGQGLSLTPTFAYQGITGLALRSNRLKRTGGAATFDHFADRGVDLADAAVEIGDRLRMNLAASSERRGLGFDR